MKALDFARKSRDAGIARFGEPEPQVIVMLASRSGAVKQYDITDIKSVPGQIIIEVEEL